MSFKELFAIMLAISLFALAFLLVYLDEHQDGVAERLCMSQVENMEFDGYTPDCNL